MKLAFNKGKKVTKPDFRKKMCLQIISLFVSKIGVFGHFLEIASLDFAKNVRNYCYYFEESSLKISGSEKNLVSRYGDFFDLGMPRQLLGKVQYLQLGGDFILHIMIVWNGLHDFTMVWLIICVINYA